MANDTRYQPAGDRYDTMKYRHCGRSGLRLPAISLGSGPINHIQKITIAAIAIADMKVWAQRS
jgi:hypothetical protein